MRNLKTTCQVVCRIVLALSMPALSWASITNVAAVTYKDALNNTLTGNSNTVVIATPPVITSAATATGDIGIAFSYSIAGTNGPTSYSATGLPAGLSVNTTSGLISGTPSAAGIFTVTINAINAAGPGSATLTLTVRSTATITLTKSANTTTAKSGDTVTYTIQYQNTGSGTASGVVITDAIPAGTTLAAGSITAGGTLSGGTITWTTGAVAGGASGSVSFQVKVN